MKMKLYICGPVSLGGTCTPEQEQENTKKFYEAERLLITAGYYVASPAKVLEFCEIMEIGDGTECPSSGVERWQWYMRRTIIQMLTCHGVATLPNAELSRGCSLELSLTFDFGMPVKTVDEWLRLAAEVPKPKDCPHKNITNVRPWDLVGGYIGDCVNCKSTVKVDPSTHNVSSSFEPKP